MSEDKGLIGNLRSFHFFHSQEAGKIFIRGGHTWVSGDHLCDAGTGCKCGFYKMVFYFLAVFKGVFEVTYLTKKHPSGNLDTIALFMIGI